MSNEALAFVATILSSGIITVLLNRLFDRMDARAKARQEAEEQQAEVKQVARRDLASELDRVYGRLDKMDTELTDWKTKYFELLAKDSHLEAQYQQVSEQLAVKDTEIAALRARVRELESEVASWRGGLAAKAGC